ncbi:hypothetical protein [Mycolicibacterium mucogenicum]|uniref:hypothetical protein n=1 Tax=Mycolicibacterium mucogenicum TaxID=56689 RepID=UPI000769E359|nr:hypothetical protein [Mycolicibacterium mucogenicum]
MAIVDDVLALVGDSPGGPQCAPHVPTAVAQITVMAKAYTRGRGFTGNTPNVELSAVIVTASARLAANGAGTQFRKKVDEVEYEWRSSFTGWTLAEQIVLNRYRVRAQ